MHAHMRTCTHAQTHPHTHTHTHTQRYWQEPLLIHLTEENEIQTQLHIVPLITEFTKLYNQSLCDMTTVFFTFIGGKNFVIIPLRKITNSEWLPVSTTCAYYSYQIMQHYLSISNTGSILSKLWTGKSLRPPLSLSEFMKLLQSLRPPLSLPDDRKNIALIPFGLYMNKIYVQYVVLSLAQCTQPDIRGAPRHFTMADDSQQTAQWDHKDQAVMHCSQCCTEECFCLICLSLMQHNSHVTLFYSPSQARNTSTTDSYLVHAFSFSWHNQFSH